jgi:hypothetical protein
LKSVKVTTKEHVFEDDCHDDEEIYQLLKEIIEEDNEFCGQLVEHFHIKYFMVSLYIQMREEFDTIFQYYQENPIVSLALELTRAYNRARSLCVVVTRKYGGKGNSPRLLRFDNVEEFHGFE